MSELESRTTVMWISNATVLFAVTNAIFVAVVLAGFGEDRAAVATALLGLAFVVAWLLYVATGRTYGMFLIGSSAALVNNFAVHLILGGFAFSGAYLAWGVANSASATLSLKRRDVIVLVLIYVVGTLTMATFESTLMDSRSAPDSTLTAILFAHVILGTLLLTVGLVFYYLRRLVSERRRSEALLLNVLPASIASRLKTNTGVIADHFDDVTVLFADIVGFTPLSSAMEPEAMVSLLNDIFSEFDELVDRYGLEKIRTIGDNYMVASGVPTPRPDHAKAAADMALDMLAVVDRLILPNGDHLQFRIGLNSGPVVAGIIGEAKFQYDVWGDTVNTASRMESHGLPGKIQLTASTYGHLDKEYVIEPRGTIDVKGKGQMETWFLVGRA